MPDEALLLTRGSLSEAGRNIAKLLDFFGVPWRAETSTQFVAHDRATAARKAHLFCSSEGFFDLITHFRCNGSREPRWLKPVESVFIFGEDDPTHLEKLVKILAGDDAIKIREADLRLQQFVVAEDSEFCGSMAGIRIEGSNSNIAQVFEVSNSRCGARELVSTAQGPIFLQIQYHGVPVFLSTSSRIIDLDRNLTTGVFDIRDHVAAALPIVLYVKWAFANTCWQPAEANACLVIDDPLVSRKYGLLNFDELLSLMKQHRFSTSIAFIPWNWFRSDCETARLFTANPDFYSLSVHGCDHTGGEFGSADRERLYLKAETALARMVSHESKTGIKFDPVMIFPQGVFSEAAMNALKHTDVIAAVNNDVISADPHPRAVKISDVWDTAVMGYSSFPIFTRRYPWEGIENFAFDILLGKPAIISIHHDFCRDRCLRLVNFIQRLNALKCRVAWRNLGDVVKRSYRQREMSPDIMDVEMYGTELRLENRFAQRKRFFIRRRECEPSAIREIRDGSGPIAWNSVNGHINFETELGPGESKTVGISFHDLDKNGRSGDTLCYRTKTMLRRYSCEVRDNYIVKGKLRLFSMFEGRTETPSNL